VIVEDAPLAKLFQRYIEYDRDGSKAEAEAGDHGAVLRSAESPRVPDLFVPVDNFAAPIEFAAPPQPTAPARLPTPPRAVKVRPLLTPDNYVGHIIDLLGSAERSVYLQYAYITYSEEPSDERFTQMLTRLAELSNRAHMDVRIIVGSGDAADKIRKLVQHGFRETAFRVQSNIHNKGIVVDGNKVLVSSANWSGDGVLRNRDAGLLIYDEEIAGYYQNVFIKDWENRAKARLDDDPPVRIAADGEPTPPGMVRMSWQDYYG
jgi:phosphatidylserine/phosphatidylglycerophosphate/cardiolipin synthase-like enzyme